jgi:uncharacterized protein YgiM (DUF1202 family)
MTTTQRLLTVIGMAGGLVLAGTLARAADPETNKTSQAPAASLAQPQPAVAKQSKVNVRARAAINSDVVTQLTKGQLVTVLEEVILPKPKPDEPARWYRIALPTNTAVWVHTDYVDKANKTVRPRRLNLRAGPGENYSVVGRVERGATLTVLEEKGLWLKVEPPAGGSAFVAAHLLSTEAAAVAAATPAAPVVAAKEPGPVTPAVTTPPPAVEPAPVVATTVVTNVVPAVATNEPVAPAPVVVVPAVDTNVLAAATNVPVVTAPAVASLTDTNDPVPPPELIRRVITREGILKSAANIQAPSHFELRGLDNNRIINYVWSPDTNIVLKAFKGQKVLVTGEEALDERWAHIPVITVEEIKAAP